MRKYRFSFVFIFTSPSNLPSSVLDPPKTPCTPSPCGSNAVCKERNGAGSCSCIPEYSGDPYVECRPECVMNSECPRNRACINNKCVDPCPGTCGLNALCSVVNHSPTCTCVPGYVGNPLSACREPLPQPISPPRKHLILFPWLYRIIYHFIPISPWKRT